MYEALAANAPVEKAAEIAGQLAETLKATEEKLEDDKK